jgi:hypothetical protein
VHHPYRLTIYDDGGLIERMLPFSSLKEDAVVFAENQRFGRHAVLSDVHGLVTTFPSHAAKGVADRLRRPRF